MSWPNCCGNNVDLRSSTTCTSLFGDAEPAPAIFDYPVLVRLDRNHHSRSYARRDSAGWVKLLSSRVRFRIESWQSDSRFALKLRRLSACCSFDAGRSCARSSRSARVRRIRSSSAGQSSRACRCESSLPHAWPACAALRLIAVIRISIDEVQLMRKACFIFTGCPHLQCGLDLSL